MFLLYGNVVETLDVWDSFVSSHKLQTGFFFVDSESVYSE